MTGARMRCSGQPMPRGGGPRGVWAEECEMSLPINDIAPDFTADTTEGPIRFHEWIGDGWAILFSHPRTSRRSAPPSSATWPGSRRSSPSGAPRSSASRSIRSRTTTSGRPTSSSSPATGSTYPMIGDPELKIAKLYDMLPGRDAGTSEGRTPADNATVRTVYIVGPDKRIKLKLTYPMTTGRNFDEILRALDFDPADGQARGGDPGAVEAGRGRDRHRRGVGRGRREALRRPSPGCCRTWRTHARSRAAGTDRRASGVRAAPRSPRAGPARRRSPRRPRGAAGCRRSAGRRRR